MRTFPVAHDASFLLQILVAVFLAILFLQSGADKVLDRSGNLAWLKSHFAKSGLAPFVPLLFAVLTLLELAAGALSGVGAIMLLAHHGSSIAWAGAVMSAVAIIALFFGQRVAKDYAGAGNLVPYFLLTLLAIYLLAPATPSYR